MSSPQEGEWISWNGGSSPVADHIRVEVRLRYGKSVVIAESVSLRWSHDLYNAYGADDIVAYRVVIAVSQPDSPPVDV